MYFGCFPSLNGITTQNTSKVSSALTNGYGCPLWKLLCVGNKLRKWGPVKFYTLCHRNAPMNFVLLVVCWLIRRKIFFQILYLLSQFCWMKFLLFFHFYVYNWKIEFFQCRIFFPLLAFQFYSTTALLRKRQIHSFCICNETFFIKFAWKIITTISSNSIIHHSLKKVFLYF